MKNISYCYLSSFFKLLQERLILAAKPLLAALVLTSFLVFQPSVANAQSCDPAVPASLGGGNQIICKGENAFLGCDLATDYCYKWLPATAFPSDDVSRMPNPWTLPLEEDTEFTLILSDDQGNMLPPITVQVDVREVELEQITSVDICAGESVSFTAQPLGGINYSYQWSNGAITQTIEVSPPNSELYKVTVTEVESGCNAIGIFSVYVDALSVIEITSAYKTICQEAPSGRPTESIGSGSSFSGCEQTSTRLFAGTGVPGYTYYWSTGETTDHIEVFESGTYTVTVTRTGGCSATASYEVENCLDLAITFDYANQNGQPILDAGSGYSSYEWQNGNTGQTELLTNSGTYSVTVVDDDTGCMATDEITFENADIEESYFFLTLSALRGYPDSPKMDIYICTQNQLSEADIANLEPKIKTGASLRIGEDSEYEKNVFWTCNAHHGYETPIDISILNTTDFKIRKFHYKRIPNSNKFNPVKLKTDNTEYQYMLSELGNAVQPIEITGQKYLMLDDATFRLLPNEVAPKLSILDSNGVWKEVARLDIKMKPLPPPTINPYRIYHDTINAVTNQVESVDVTGQVITIGEFVNSSFRLKKVLPNGSVVDVVFEQNYSGTDPNSPKVYAVSWRENGNSKPNYYNLPNIQYKTPKYDISSNNIVNIRGLLDFNFPVDVTIQVVDVPLVPGYFVTTPNPPLPAYLCDTLPTAMEMINSALALIESNAGTNAMFNKVKMGRRIDIELSTAPSAPGTEEYGTSTVLYTNSSDFFVDKKFVVNWGTAADPQNFKECPKTIVWSKKITPTEWDSISNAITDVSNNLIPMVVGRIAQAYPDIATLIESYCINQNPDNSITYNSDAYLKYQNKSLAYIANNDEIAMIGADENLTLTLNIGSINAIERYLEVTDPLGQKTDAVAKAEWLSLNGNNCVKVNGVRQEMYASTIAHEIAHMCYAIDHAGDVLKWSKYADMGFLNSCYPRAFNLLIGEYCSIARGHEYKNPDNSFTCNSNAYFPPPTRQLGF